MTEFTPPPAPGRTLPSFGTSIVGPEFEWQAVTDDGVETIKARAAASISFDQTLRYTTGRHAQLVQTMNSAKQMRDQLAEMNPTDPEYQVHFDRLIEERLVFEQAAWEAAIDTMLLLVRESDRDKLRPALLQGDPKQVHQLREWLEQQVIKTAETEAAVSTGVDPTSGPSPENSPSSPDSGGDSGSKEPTSTD